MPDVPFRRLRPVRARDDAATPTPRDPADQALFDAGRGDEAAFALVYDATAGLVYGIARRVVRDPEMAEDIAQETFVDAWRLAPRFDPALGSARTWLATIAHRKAVDRVRSEEARRAREDDERARVRPDGADVAEQVTDRLDRRRVRDALDELTETQREAVTMAYYGGRTYREVAALLDVPEGTVKTRIRDGLIRLRDTMAGHS